ncbi:integrase/recombinase XerC [Desulfohalotomaculum tongense]|uniref:tyrosine-type recombinase/integrase n=1 Tax=Desulforadius tongensis TaxID=1216062 RepID=UPI00195653D2|nr:tyrosine-type recombinase/integrase [Desulforadius tongensis]MBM7854970.1 integrase/recombinase XerC [Desulforadius tongensis]
MQLFDNYKNYLIGRSYSERTVYIYLKALYRFKQWIERRYTIFDPAAITSLDIADYRRYLQNQGKKPATVNLAIDVIKAFFSWANSNGCVKVNPAAEVKRVSEQRKAPEWLNKKEIGSLMRAVQKYGTLRDYTLITLLFHTGLRINEACSLKKEDLVIRERSGYVCVRHGKGDKYREVPLNITARKVLETYMAAEFNDCWLFPGRKGPISTRTAERIIKKYAQLSGVEVTPHTLRHTFGKLLVDAGESLDRVAVLMGHSNLNTTARYTKPSLHDLESSVEKITWD